MVILISYPYWLHYWSQSKLKTIFIFQIFYLVTSSPQKLENGTKFEEETEVVPASTTSHSLVFLDKYTEYRFVLIEFIDLLYYWNFYSPKSWILIIQKLERMSNCL